MLDAEILMVTQFHWTLIEIDETDYERIFEFVFYFSYRRQANAEHAERGEQIYADDANWL